MEPSIEDRIAALSDALAIRLLLSVAGAHYKAMGEPLAPETALLREILTSLSLPEVKGRQAEPSDGAAARAALVVLSEEKHFGEVLQALLDTPAPAKAESGLAGSMLLAGGLLLALQTHFKIQLMADGNLAWKVVKPPTDKALLGVLIRKLLSILE